MKIRLFACMLAAGLFACADAPEDAPDTEPGAVPAPEPAAALDLFVEEPTDAQLVFIAEERSTQAAQWPGAVFVPFSTFSVERDGIPNEFPPADSMAALLGAAGVRGDRVVLVGAPIHAARAFAAFDYLGLGDRAALLDGGLSALGAPPAEAPVAGTAPTELDIDVRDDMIVDAAWVHARLNDPNVVILDARPPTEFSGDTPGEGIDRPGHIPGAHNLFWETLVQSPDNPRLKDETELRRLFEEAGAAAGRTLVAYCRTGGQASFLYTVARHLGYDVRLYDGSFVDWSRTEYPVER